MRGLPHTTFLVLACLYVCTATDGLREDALAMLQVGGRYQWSQRTQAEAGKVQAGFDNPGLKAYGVDGQTFELTRGKRHFVASAAVNVAVPGLKIHCYDIALYLDRQHHAWGHAGNRAKTIRQMVDHTDIVLVVRTRLTTKQTTADSARRLDRFAAGFGIENYTKTLQDYQTLWLKGPDVGVGTEILFEPRHDAVAPRVAGKPIGRVESDWLGLVLIEGYLGEHGDLPEFREAVFSQLAAGIPSEVGVPAQGVSRVQASGKVVIAFVIIVALLSTCCCFCVFRYWPGKR